MMSVLERCVDEDVAARRHDLAGRRGHFRHVRVGNLLEHRPERPVTVLCENELLPGPFLGRQLRRGRDPHDVAFEDVPELVDLENQLERLVPRDVLEAHGHGAADVGVEDDVELRELAEPLERVLDVRVLEVQRDRFARVLLVPRAERARLVRVRDLARLRGGLLLVEQGLGRFDERLVLGRLLALGRGRGSRRDGLRRRGDDGRGLGLRDHPNLRRRGHEAGRLVRGFGDGWRGGGRRGLHFDRLHDGLARILDLVLLVGTGRRGRRDNCGGRRLDFGDLLGRRDDPVGRRGRGFRPHERGRRHGRGGRRLRGGNGRRRVRTEREGEARRRGPGGGLDGSGEIEHDTRDWVGAALELRDADTRHGRVLHVLGFLRRREEDARQVDDVARRVRERERVVSERAVAGERHDETATALADGDARQARRACAGRRMVYRKRWCVGYGETDGCWRGWSRRGRRDVLRLHAGLGLGRGDRGGGGHDGDGFAGGWRGDRDGHGRSRRRFREGHGHGGRARLGRERRLEWNPARELELDVRLAHLREGLHLEAREKRSVGPRGLEPRRGHRVREIDDELRRALTVVESRGERSVSCQEQPGRVAFGEQRRPGQDDRRRCRGVSYGDPVARGAAREQRHQHRGRRKPEGREPVVPHDSSSGLLEIGRAPSHSGPFENRRHGRPFAHGFFWSASVLTTSRNGFGLVGSLTFCRKVISVADTSRTSPSNRVVPLRIR